MNDWGSDEHELVRRCRDGSEAAYAELVRQHRPRLNSLAFRLAGDRETAEDVVQETFSASSSPMSRSSEALRRARLCEAARFAIRTVIVLSQGASDGFGSNRSIWRKAARKVSWTTSSAVSRSPASRKARL